MMPHLESVGAENCATKISRAHSGKDREFA